MGKRFLPPATVRLFVSLVVLSALNVHAQGTPPARPIVLEVAWTLDSRQADHAYVKIAMQGRYEVELFKNPFSGRVGARACTGYEVAISEIKDGVPFCFRLKYLGGSLLKAEGAFGREKAVFQDDSAPSGPEWQIDGMIQSRADGLVQVVLNDRPGWLNANASAEEALGCWHGGWPAPTMSYAELRNLHNLHRKWTAPSFSPELEGCSGTATAEIRASGVSEGR